MSISWKGILLNRKTLMFLFSALALVCVLLFGWIFRLNDELKISGGALIVSLVTLGTTTGFSLHSLNVQEITSSKDLYINKVDLAVKKLEEELGVSNIELLHSRLRLAHIVIEELSDEQVKQLLPDELQDRANFFIAHAKEYENHLKESHKISDWLDSDFMQNEQLKLVASEACDSVLSSPCSLEWLGSSDLHKKKQFCEEIYELLAVWLPNSIRYDMPLPLPNKVVPKEERMAFADRAIYRDAISYIKNQGIVYFWRETEQESETAQIIIADYLEHLLKLIDPTANLIAKPHL